MDIKEIKKHRLKIAAAAITIVLLAVFIPKLFVDKNGITASGTIEIREVDLASRVASRVVKIMASDGASVKRGEALAMLDDSVVSAQKEAAETVMKNATKNYERFRNLLETGSVSSVEYEQAQSAYISAKAAYAQAKMMADDAVITAPWDGVILERHVEEGELVSMNAPIFTLGDMKTARVTIYVPLADLAKIKYGQEAFVTIDGMEKKPFKGSITYISAAAEFTPKNVQTKDERVKQVFRVEVTVPNPDMILKPGVQADVRISEKQLLITND
ncbi:MAG TPA: efflux RND transporter periplasmic adaptor subunit [Candidatus Goldiibacteriota bacterium]|nr:efflux RND transporter periplasmic adaptor subunit [Candidatus Goldiibacteriota bacterium]